LLVSEAPENEAPKSSPERLQLLEGRRLALDESMWQVPALTVAGQAFLLQVLTDGAVGWDVAVPVMLAGATASAAAGLSLLQQWDREQLHSTIVADVAQDLDLGDPRRKALKPEVKKPPKRWSRWWLSWLFEWRALWFWVSTMVVFLVADIVALVATRVWD
jgi:hypothetical protein